MNIGDTWSSIRTILMDEFSFTNIKNIMGAAGLPIHKLYNLNQQDGATKDKLMGEIDSLLINLSSDETNRVVSYCIEEIITRKSDIIDDLSKILERIGWGISNNIPYPLKLQSNIELFNAPDFLKNSFSKAIKRYRDGDSSGTITVMCGMVDNLTAKVYDKYSLGDHKNSPYHERISKSFNALKKIFKNQFTDNLLDKDKKLLWQNQSQSISQAAYVLGLFRREYSDVHGEQNNIPSNFIIQRAIDCSIYIINNLSSLIEV